MEEISVVENHSEKEKNNEKFFRKRIYHNTRLDNAFKFQEKILWHGKVTAPVITLLSFLGGFLGVFGLIGLISYWVVYFKNKEKLEKIEEELFVAKKRFNMDGDISDLKCIWFKYGPMISYVISILTAIFYTLMFMLSHGED